jgi:L,D-transpeptidase YbiS
VNKIKQTLNHLLVNINEQTMNYYHSDELVKSYKISTAKNGIGSEMGSNKTPLGWHIIRAKIGDGMPIGTIFKGRRVISKIFDISMLESEPNNDWILSRILWLSGLEKGKNRLGNVDTMQRYIYIHGIGDESKIGKPNSQGCINMINEDIIELFDNIPTGSTVYIQG